MVTQLSHLYTFSVNFDGSILNKYTMDKWHYIFDFYKIVDIFSETFSDFIDMCENGDENYYNTVKRLLITNRLLERQGFEIYMPLEEFNAIYPEIIKEMGKPVLFNSNRFFTLVSKKINKEHIAIYELLISEHDKMMLYNN